MRYASTILTTTSLLVLACPATPTRSPEPARELPTLPDLANPEAEAIRPEQAVLVRPRAIGPAASWRFEPSLERVAVRDERGCGVWQRSGEYLGAAPAQTCAAGLAPKSIVWNGERMILGKEDHRFELRLAGDRFELEGTALRGRTKSGRYVAAAFGPDGGLALVVRRPSDELLVEIWTDEGKRERVLELELGDAFDPDVSELVGVWLGWSLDSIHALVDLRGSDERDEDRSLVAVTWPESDRRPIVRVFPGLYDPNDAEDPEVLGSIDDLWLSPDEATLFVGFNWLIPDEGYHHYQVAVSLDTLTDTPLQPNIELYPDIYAWRPTGEGEAEAEEAEAEEAEAEEAEAEAPDGSPAIWSDLVGSANWSLTEVPGEYGDEGGWAWERLALTRIPDAGIELAYSRGFVSSTEANMQLAATKLDWATIAPCPYEECEPSEPDWNVPDGCTLIDASWNFADLLMVCGDEWRTAATPEPGQTLDLASTTTLARGTGQARARWGPGGLALFGAGEGLRVFVADELVATHAVDALLHARLDEELDSALVQTSAGPRVVDLASGELGVPLAWTQAIEHAAFGPDRRLLALAGAGELAVFERDRPAPLVHLRAEALAGLAFRQDGAALYVGVERALPELALDPRTGARLEGAQLDRGLLARLAAASLDPSWRWAIEPDRTLIRTLDGQALIWPNPSEAPHTAILESGWFCGPREALSEYRLHVGPDSPAPVLPLPDAFARPDLLREFANGAELPAPRLPPSHAG